jgi:IS1 family transposase
MPNRCPALNRLRLRPRRHSKEQDLSELHESLGAYTRHIDPDEHQAGKRYTQKIERKHLTLQTQIKQLTRKTICSSKSIQMHHIVIGLFINQYKFGLRF